MKLEFNFSKSEIVKLVIFKVVVITVLVLMHYMGADFR